MDLGVEQRGTWCVVPTTRLLRSLAWAHGWPAARSENGSMTSLYNNVSPSHNLELPRPHTPGPFQSKRGLGTRGIKGQVKGFRMSLPKMCHFNMQTILNQCNQDPADSRKTLTSLLATFKSLDRGSGPKRELLSRDNSYLNVLSVWQDHHLITMHLFVLSCQSPSSPLKPQTTVPFLCSRWHISINYPACPHCFCGAPIHM